MTKPKFVNHFTTGMFNYVVKDPYSSRLSGEFWIKDQTGQATSCVLELVFAWLVALVPERSTVFATFALQPLRVSVRLSDSILC